MIFLILFFVLLYILLFHYVFLICLHFYLQYFLVLVLFQNFFEENGFTSVYFIDGEDVYKVNPVTREIIKVEIEELLEINPEGSTIIKETKNTFSLCHLLECFYNICKDLLSKLCPINCNSKSSYQELILNRDLIWMAINVIRYCIDLGQYYEAQRFLEQIQGCGTICRQYDVNKLKQAGGCGCSR